MKAIFSSHPHQLSLEERGYTVIKKLLSDSEVHRLREFYREQFPENVSSGFHVSNYNGTFRQKKETSSLITHIIGNRIFAFINGYHPLVGFYYVKEADEKEPFYIHLDWSMIDEGKGDSLAVWVPLVDTNHENGTLVMLPGSHKETLRYRGSPGFCFPPYDENTLTAAYPPVELMLECGDAAVWTHRLFHGSTQNKSGKQRIAASLILTPAGIQPLHYHLCPDGKLEIYRTDENFFATFDIRKSPPPPYLAHTVEHIQQIGTAEKI